MICPAVFVSLFGHVCAWSNYIGSSSRFIRFPSLDRRRRLRRPPRRHTSPANANTRKEIMLHKIQCTLSAFYNGK